jgi:hypothetical protein
MMMCCYTVTPISSYIPYCASHLFFPPSDHHPPLRKRACPDFGVTVLQTEETLPWTAFLRLHGGVAGVTAAQEARTVTDPPS